MANKQSMILVAGTTYRIQAVCEHHEVIRISDNRKVGAFQHRPALRVLEGEIAAIDLLEVAKTALRTGRLPWARPDLSREPTGQRRDAAPTRRRSAARTLASLLVVLWPSA